MARHLKCEVRRSFLHFFTVDEEDEVNKMKANRSSSCPPPSVRERRDASDHDDLKDDASDKSTTASCCSRHSLAGDRSPPGSDLALDYAPSDDVDQDGVTSNNEDDVGGQGDDSTTLMVQNIPCRAGAEDVRRLL
jgi:hypothetical protein